MAAIENLPCIKEEMYSGSASHLNGTDVVISNMKEGQCYNNEDCKGEESCKNLHKTYESCPENVELNENCNSENVNLAANESPTEDKCRLSTETLVKDIKERHTDNKNVLTCPYCQKKFENENTFDKHKEIHAGGWPFMCHICHKGFLLHHLLESHAAYHKTEIFPCATCDKKCVSRYKLKLHMRMHGNQFSCRICKQSFSTKECLKIHKTCHKRNNIKKQIYICKICSAKFSVHLDLKLHLRMHTTDWPFSCDVCKKLYRRKGSFLTHVSKCLGLNPYTCDICNKAFIRQRQFVQHVHEIHNGIRPFSCNVCNKRFNSKSNLEIHSQVHSARLPTIYKCSLCQQMFTSLRKLRGHKIREHSLYRPYKCNTCRKLFLLKSQLSNHSKEHKIKEL